MPPSLLHPEQGPWTSLREEKRTPNMSSIHGGLLTGPLEGVLTVYLSRYHTVPPLSAIPIFAQLVQAPTGLF